MNSFEAFADLYTLANTYAHRPDIVQGAGGNFSIKNDDGLMLIKASGREFGDITKEGSGIVPVLYTQLKEKIKDGSLRTANERERLSVMQQASHTRAHERPSMETWFHTLLPAYVLHTHSIYVNVLACTSEGTELFLALMKEAGLSCLTLSYHNPGFELGQALHEALRGTRVAPPVIFLENHGVIVSAGSAQECIALHDDIEKRIKTKFTIANSDFSLDGLSTSETEDFNSYTLFPDQVVYPTHPAIRAAHRFILKEVQQNNLSIRTISSTDIETLTNLDSEKHRRKIQKSE